MTIEIEKERSVSPKLTRKIVYEKKATKYEGVSRFVHKLRLYLIAAFLFLNSTTNKKIPSTQLEH